MSQIRSENTKPEDIVRKYLFSRGLRYRKNDKRYPGHPDIVLPKYRTIIFVHGCFWHCHKNCKSFVLPKTNTEYWIPKLEKNRNRDISTTAWLRQNGWRVIVIWECELKKQSAQQKLEWLYNQIIQ